MAFLTVAFLLTVFLAVDFFAVVFLSSFFYSCFFSCGLFCCCFFGSFLSGCLFGCLFCWLFCRSFSQGFGTVLFPRICADKGFFTVASNRNDCYWSCSKVLDELDVCPCILRKACIRLALLERCLPAVKLLEDWLGIVHVVNICREVRYDASVDVVCNTGFDFVHVIIDVKVSKDEAVQ